MHARPVILSLLLLLSLAGATGAVDLTDTRLLAEPAVSADHVAFAYDGDLWVASLEGGEARRLTTAPGEERRPRFSPDGELLAFSGEYDGNVDAFIVPVAGGVPRRLTWHPDPDEVEGFTPDGTRVLFRSPRQAFTRRHTQLFTIPVGGGWAERLPIPHGEAAAYSPDGLRIAYNPLAQAFREWKNYRGGRASRIWIYDTRDHSVQQIPQPEGRCNDVDAVWIGPRIYFRSDRAGEFNVFAFDPATEDLEQLTFFDDFPVLGLQGAEGHLVFEQAGYLHLYGLESNRPQRLHIGVASDLLETRPRYETGDEFVRDADLSPTGVRAAFEFRGEIVTVPAEKGDPRNLTRSAGAHERSPVFSPNGAQIAYFSDAGAEYELHVAAADGKGEVRRFPLGGAKGGHGFYFDPHWAPDGARISFSDNAWSLFVLELSSGEVTKVASEHRYGPERARALDHAWSPDSQWLAYTLNTPASISQIWFYSVAEGTSHPVTDGMSDASDPVFDAGGKLLFFFASTDAGPVKQWFAMSNADMEITRALYLAVLPAGEPSPLAKESDEEGKPAPAVVSRESPPPVRIDFEGLEHRIVAVPVPAGALTDLSAGPAGTVYYLRRSRLGASPLGPGPEAGSLTRFDLESREPKVLAQELLEYHLSGDRKRVLYRAEDGWGVAELGESIDVAKGRIAPGEISVRVDPRAEWPQIFDEAWRINRDYFYDPNFHGADWPAMREKYRQFLPHLATRQDLNRVIRWMSSELAVGHHRVSGGDSRSEVDSVPGGLLGADFTIEQGRYRIEKVYGGLNWNPDLRSPLTEPGVDVVAGEFLLAVEGVELTAESNLYRPFEKTAGKLVEITVGPNSDGSGARTVQVVPIESETALRNRDWVEGNLRKVEQATGGRVAYVYVPNTTRAGHTYFKRYFFPQVDKQAIIIDERFNGGGQVADYYIDHLRRPEIAHWATRYGDDIRTPGGSIPGPKVMIIDETAGSGGDLLPFMFRKLGLGTLVGRRTWGGLVGILGFPVLMDGGVVTAPNLAIWTEDGFVVENEGVPPDVEVEQWPAAVVSGGDPQLERAIAIALEELERNPPVEPTRPPYPVRARR